ncbi:hypothetical protein F511_38258 [Dorcoceras hygrometricum]|uniref:Uncharacterized protein n=1 Tax=Dorcoceras hygrometricum TaxID=472368 RepID=A0A2Z7B846_9LAMI|nr:hypothetical protein F511_38258 [Dorcoceras hygrometricum]
MSQRPFVDAFAPICIFVEPVQDLGSQPPFIRTWGWARVCVDIVQFNIFGHILPVGTYNLCTYIVAVGPVVDRSAVPKRILNDVQHCIQVEGFCDFFVQHADQSISSDSSSESVESIGVTSPDAILNFSSSSSSQSENPNFSSSSSDSPMHLTADDIPKISSSDVVLPIGETTVGLTQITETPVFLPSTDLTADIPQISLPSAIALPMDYTEAFA